MHFAGMVPEILFLWRRLRVMTVIILVMAHKLFNDLINIRLITTFWRFKATWLLPVQLYH